MTTEAYEDPRLATDAPIPSALRSPKTPGWVRQVLEQFMSYDQTALQTSRLLSDTKFLADSLSESKTERDEVRARIAAYEDTPPWMREAILEFNALDDYWDRQKSWGEAIVVAGMINYL